MKNVCLVYGTNTQNNGLLRDGYWNQYGDLMKRSNLHARSLLYSGVLYVGGQDYNLLLPCLPRNKGIHMVTWFSLESCVEGRETYLGFWKSECFMFCREYDISWKENTYSCKVELYQRCLEDERFSIQKIGKKWDPKLYVNHVIDHIKSASISWTF